MPTAFGGLVAWLPWFAFAAAVATTPAVSAAVLAVPDGRQNRNNKSVIHWTKMRTMRTQWFTSNTLPAFYLHSIAFYRFLLFAFWIISSHSINPLYFPLRKLKLSVIRMAWIHFVKLIVYSTINWFVSWHTINFNFSNCALSI